MRLPLCLTVVGPGSQVIIAGLGGVQQVAKDCKNTQIYMVKIHAKDQNV